MLLTTGKEKPLEARVQEVPLAIQHVHLQKSGVRSIPVERTVTKRTSELLGPGGVRRRGVRHSCRQQYNRGLDSSQASALHCREHGKEVGDGGIYQ